MAYKGSKNLLPKSLQNRYLPTNLIHNHRTKSVTHKNIFHKPTRKAIKSKCASIRGVGLFNSLPKEIKSAKSIYIFKRKLKQMYFSTYYND